MPKNLIFVRHGESEGNVANRLSRKGDNRVIHNKTFKARHSSEWRLSEQGIPQAQWAGDIIRLLEFTVGRKYSSPYFRAMETMSYMDLPGPTLISYDVRERSWGKLDNLSHEERMTKYALSFANRKKDPFLWEPPGGESLVAVRGRVYDFLSTLHRECGHMECVVVSCHAEVMEVVRVILERMLPKQYREMKNDPTQGIWNGSVLHYTRVDPHNGEEHDFFGWVKLTTPLEAHQAGETGFFWRDIIRPVFTNDELLEYVDRHAPPLKLF
jgi:broad specificity phosphatase PhoE